MRHIFNHFILRTCSQAINISSHSYNQISQIKSTKRTIAQVRRVATSYVPTSTTYGRCELDSHADTIVAGANCIILQYTGQECSVHPYSDSYAPKHNVPIVNVATAFQCQETGQTYILILNECLWMGDTLKHSLINPNQLRHFGTKV